MAENVFEHSGHKNKFEITSQTELEEAERIVAIYQEAIGKYKTAHHNKKNKISRMEVLAKKESGWLEPDDGTAFVVRKGGEYANSYSMELKILEHDFRPENVGGIYYLSKVEGGWEFKPLLRNNFDTILNRFFKVSEQGGMVLEVIKPAIVRGHEEEGKIVVDSFMKGELKTGRPA